MTSNVENMPPISTPDPDQIKQPKQKTKSVSSDRKKLQTLQPSGKNQKLLVGLQFNRLYFYSSNINVVSRSGLMEFFGCLRRRSQ